jgi:hypothetical protein
MIFWAHPKPATIQPSYRRGKRRKRMGGASRKGRRIR